jgi:hypothetical protein
MKLEKVKEVPYNLPEEGQEERQQAIMKLAKRIPLASRELEISALDIAMYSKTLSKGQFPRSYVKDISDALDKASTELARIKKGWDEVFNA